MPVLPVGLTRLSFCLHLRLLLPTLALVLVSLLPAHVLAHHLQPPPDLPSVGARVGSIGNGSGGAKPQADDGPCRARFGDVTPSHPACRAIELLVREGVIDGYPDGTFRPENSITRAEFAKLLIRALKVEPQPGVKLAFSDTEDHWAARGGYLQAAVDIEAIAGFPDGTFRPDDPVTRAQAVKMVTASMGYGVDVLGDLAPPYADLDADDWFTGWVTTAHRAGFIGIGPDNPFAVWTGGLFQGDVRANRGESAIVLANLFKMNETWQALRPLWSGSLGQVPYAHYVQGVNLAFGNFTFTVTDVRTEGGRGLPTLIQRTYNSFGTDDGGFGNRWSFSYDLRLESGYEHPDDRYVTLPSGRRIRFTPEGSGFRADPGVLETLARSSDGTYTLTDQAHVRYHFASDGRLAAMTDRNNNHTTFTRTGNTLTITDAHLRKFDLTYEDDRIHNVRDPLGSLWTYDYSAVGELIRVTDPRGGVTYYGYDDEHRLTKITGPRQERNPSTGQLEPITVLELAYDWHGRVKWQRDGDDFETFFAYFPLSRQTAVKDAAGGITWRRHDGDLRVVEKTGPLGHKETYAYDHRHLLEKVTDSGGRSTWRQYDHRGNLLTESMNLGMKSFESTTTWKYHDTFNKPTQITNALGHTTEFRYDERGNLRTRVDPPAPDDSPWADPELRTTHYFVDTAGLPEKVIDPLDRETNFNYAFNPDGSYQEEIKNPLGQVTITKYDVLGRKISVTDRLGYTTTYAYLPTGELELVTSPDGITRHEFDAAGNRIGTTDPRSAVTATTFNHRNLPREVTDPLGYITRYGYDGLGRQDRVENGRGGLTTRRYDRAGRLEAEITLLDKKAGQNEDVVIEAKTTYRYNPDGTLHQITDPEGRLTTFAYFPDGRVSAVHKGPDADPLESRRFAYDRLGRKVSETDDTGVTFRYEYDALGQLHKVIDARGNATEHTYDRLGNRVQTRFADGLIHNWEYDELDRLRRGTLPKGQVTNVKYAIITTPEGKRQEQVTTTDGEGYSTRHYYGFAGRLVQVIDQAGGETAYWYDPVGNLHQVTNARRHTWVYDHDRRGQLRKETDPTGVWIEYDYDDAGNRTLIGYPDGIRVTNRYDLANRLVETHTSDGVTITHEYDRDGNRTLMTDATGTSEFTFDAASRLQTQQVPGARQAMAYAYDRAGRVKTVTGHDGLSTAYGYDELVRLDSLAPAGSGAIELDFYASGKRKEIRYPNGITGSYVYDDAGRLESLTWQPRSGPATRFAYGYDRRGFVTSRTDELGTTTYDYDPRGWLKAETLGDQETAYDYDPAGNRLSRTVRKGATITESTAYTYDVANRLLTAGGKSFTWDARGNQTGDGENTYHFDGLNRLASVSLSGGRVVSYTYNGDGQQVARTIVGNTTRYFWDSDKLVLETDATGQVQGRTAFAGNPLFRHTPDQGSAYFLFDGHGDVRRLVGPGGQEFVTYAFDAFGQPTSETGAYSNPFRYTGEQWDSAAGLYNLRARQYAPGLGRFVSPDSYRGTLNHPWSMHRYIYAAGNPLVFTDPTGHMPEDLNCPEVICQSSNGYFFTDGHFMNEAYRNDPVVPTPAASPPSASPLLNEPPVQAQDDASSKLAAAGVLILLDENVSSLRLAEQLRQLGFNAKTMKEAGLPIGQRFPDTGVVQWAKNNGAWVLTKNYKDFQKLGFNELIKVKGDMNVDDIVKSMRQVNSISESDPSVWTRSIPLAASRFRPPITFGPLVLILNLDRQLRILEEYERDHFGIGGT